MTEEIKADSKRISRNDVIGISVLIGIMATAIFLLPITTDQAFSALKQRINDSKTCADIIKADQVPFGASSMVNMFDTTNSVKKTFDAKAHELCKPLYDLQKKYGDITLDDISKMSCTDLNTLIKTAPMNQEVINYYVSNCGVNK